MWINKDNTVNHDELLKMVSNQVIEIEAYERNQLKKKMSADIPKKMVVPIKKGDEFIWYENKKDRTNWKAQ